LCGAPHAGDHDAEHHGDLTEQHVRPLHLPPIFPARTPLTKRHNRRAAGVRIGAGSVPVKDRYQNEDDAKSIDSGKDEDSKNAASKGALRRGEQEKRAMRGLTGHG
jgi:hypothetical protein